MYQYNFTGASMMNARRLQLLFVAAASAKEIVVNFPDRGPAYPIGTITLR